VTWVLVWIALGLALGVWVWITRGATAAAEYYAAYLVEISLSVDNIFIFVIIFSELHIPVEYRRRVLRVGILSALVLRALSIGAGITLIERFHWVIYPFGGLILFAAWRMVFGTERERRVVEGACDVCTTWIARLVRVSPVLTGDQFWRREGGRLVATPLFVALVLIETTESVLVHRSASLRSSWSRPLSCRSGRLIARTSPTPRRRNEQTAPASDLSRRSPDQSRPPSWSRIFPISHI